MVGTAVHRDTDNRVCGATTNVVGQSNVFVNNLLASVQGDINSHGQGALSATVNDGTVFINNIKVVLLGSSASPDLACAPAGPPHCDPKSSSASPDVFACGGPPPTSENAVGADPTGDELYPGGRPTTTSGGGPGGDKQRTDPDGVDSYDNAPRNQADQTSIDELESDPAWEAKLQEMEAKYPGFRRDELYDIIKGESAFVPDAYNDSGASGLFQFMPTSAKEIGYNTADIRRMTPVQQLEVYDDYLDRWNYDSRNHLGVMQAAPSKAGSSPNTVVYRRGSAAYAQNTPWRPADGGHITVQSISDYYNRKS
jgi:hypothetical protein